MVKVKNNIFTYKKQRLDKDILQELIHNGPITSLFNGHARAQVEQGAVDHIHVDIGLQWDGVGPEACHVQGCNLNQDEL